MAIPFLSALFLVLTSPYTGNPASALGHVILLEADSSKPYPLWNTVGYMADIGDVNGFTYVTRGIFGGFPARYEILPFYEKIGQYSDIEKRDLWLYPLRVSGEELKRFKDTLSVWAEREYPYMFFNINCVDGIYALLKETLDSIPKAPPVLTPQNLVGLLGKGGRLGEPVHLHADGSVGREDSKYKLPHKYSRFDIGITFEKEFYFQLNLLPLLHGFKDRSVFFTPFIEYELLALSVNFNREDFRVKEFWLLKMQSLSPHEPVSWLLDAGIVPINADMGIGRSFEMTQSVYTGFLIRNSLVREHKKYRDLAGTRIFFGGSSLRTWRWGLYYEHLYDFAETAQNISVNSWLGFDISKNLSVFAESKWSNKSAIAPWNSESGYSINIMSRFYF